MLRPTLIGGLLAATAALTTGPAAAQDASGALQDAVAEIARTATVTAEYGDIDQDGTTEALVVYTDDCNGVGCLFSIVDESADGTPAPVAYQYGETPELVSEARLVSANGVYWSWNGRSLLPWSDMYGTLEFYKGTDADRAAVLEVQPWHKGLRGYDIRIANVDLVGDEAPERFMYLDGSEYAVAQAQPYFVFDADGRLLTEGAMIDRPFLFQLADRKAAALIINTGSRFETSILE